MKISNDVDKTIEDTKKIEEYSNHYDFDRVDVEAMKLINYKLRAQPGQTIDEFFENSGDYPDGVIFFDMSHLIFDHIPTDSFKNILHLRPESYQRLHNDPGYRNKMYEKLIFEIAPQAGIVYGS